MLSLDSISEAGGTSTITATLSGTSSEAITLTVMAVVDTGTANADFMLGTPRTLTIAAGELASAETNVILTTIDNTVSSGSKTVTISATVTAGAVAANTPVG